MSYINLRLSYIKHFSITSVSYGNHICTHIYSYKKSATFIMALLTIYVEFI